MSICGLIRASKTQNRPTSSIITSTGRLRTPQVACTGTPSLKPPPNTFWYQTNRDLSGRRATIPRPQRQHRNLSDTSSQPPYTFARQSTLNYAHSTHHQVCPDSPRYYTFQ